VLGGDAEYLRIAAVNCVPIPASVGAK